MRIGNYNYRYLSRTTKLVSATRRVCTALPVHRAYRETRNPFRSVHAERGNKNAVCILQKPGFPGRSSILAKPSDINSFSFKRTDFRNFHFVAFLYEIVIRIELEEGKTAFNVSKQKKTFLRFPFDFIIP